MRGTILGVLIMSTIVFWGLYWDPHFGKVPNIYNSFGMPSKYQRHRHLSPIAGLTNARSATLQPTKRKAPNPLKG